MINRNIVSGAVAALAWLVSSGLAWAGSGGVSEAPILLPEPATIGILASAVGGLLWLRSRRK